MYFRGAIHLWSLGARANICELTSSNKMFLDFPLMFGRFVLFYACEECQTKKLLVCCKMFAFFKAIFKNREMFVCDPSKCQFKWSITFHTYFLEFVQFISNFNICK